MEPKFDWRTGCRFMPNDIKGRALILTPLTDAEFQAKLAHALPTGPLWELLAKIDRGEVLYDETVELLEGGYFELLDGTPIPMLLGPERCYFIQTYRSAIEHILALKFASDGEVLALNQGVPVAALDEPFYREVSAAGPVERCYWRNIEVWICKEQAVFYYLQQHQQHVENVSFDFANGMFSAGSYAYGTELTEEFLSSPEVQEYGEGEEVGPPVPIPERQSLFIQEDRPIFQTAVPPPMRFEREITVENIGRYCSKILKKRIYAYNHFEQFKYSQTDIITKIQLSMMPRIILIKSASTILVLDPANHKQYPVDYATLLEWFIRKTFNVPAGGSIELSEYDIRAVISHAHPDHWTGLGHLAEVLGRPIEVIVPQDTLRLMQQYEREYIAPEDQQVTQAVNWTPAFLKTVREICDIYLMRPAFPDIEEKVIFNTNLTPIGNTIFQTWEDAHGGMMLWLIYNDQGQELIFIDDLFPPSFALATSFYPHSSLRNLDGFYEMLTQYPNASFFWNHFIRHDQVTEPLSFSNLMRLDAEFMDWVDEVQTVFRAYLPLGKQFSDILQDKHLFNKIYQNLVFNERLFLHFFSRYLPRKKIYELKVAVRGIINYLTTKNRLQFRSITIPTDGGEERKFHFTWKRFRIIPRMKDFNPDEFRDALFYLTTLLNISIYIKEMLSSTDQGKKKV